MTAIQQIPFLYSYTGGMTPETLEVFWVRADGIAEYVTGFPWPQQPPFDEIGHYRGLLTTEDRNLLHQLALDVQRDRPFATTNTRSFDSGIEFFRAHIDEQLIETEWSPTRCSAKQQVLATHVRRLISTTRSTPLSTVRASLDCQNGGKNIYLTLQNRGSKPFVFYDAQHADEDLRIQPHIREATADESQQPPNPLVLVHLKPLALLNSPRWQTDPDGKTLLEPGQSLRTEIQPDALRLFAHGTLECLVRISFWRATPEGEDLLERGWAMPAPSKVGFGMEAEKTTA